MMRAILLLAMMGLALFSCKTGGSNGKTGNTTEEQAPEKPVIEQSQEPVAPSASVSVQTHTEYVTATIDGKKWQATQVTPQRLGDLLVIKAQDKEGRVLSITIPYRAKAKVFVLSTENSNAISWAVSRDEGFTYTAPYKGYDNQGKVEISAQDDTTLEGTFETMVSGGGKPILISNGRFRITFP